MIAPSTRGLELFDWSLANWWSDVLASCARRKSARPANHARSLKAAATVRRNSFSASPFGAGLSCFAPNPSVSALRVSIPDAGDFHVHC